jgi:hypothetical protein
MNKLPKLHLICGQDQLRPMFGTILIENGKAFATDAFIAIELELSNLLESEIIEFLEGKVIDFGIWSILCECERFSITSGQLSCLTNKGWIAFPYLSQLNDKYPDVKKAIDDAFLKDNTDSKIGLNLNKLDLLRKCLRYETNQNIILNITETNKAICITNESEYYLFRCILMPITIL